MYSLINFSLSITGKAVAAALATLPSGIKVTLTNPSSNQAPTPVTLNVNDGSFQIVYGISTKDQTQLRISNNAGRTMLILFVTDAEWSTSSSSHYEVARGASLDGMYYKRNAVALCFVVFTP